MFCLHVYWGITCVSGGPGGHRRELDLLKVELNAIVNGHMSAENWTWVFWGESALDHWAISPAAKFYLSKCFMYSRLDWSLLSYVGDYFALHKLPLLYMPKINLLRTTLLCWGESPFPIAKIIPWNKSNQGEKRQKTVRTLGCWRKNERRLKNC